MRETFCRQEPTRADSSAPTNTNYFSRNASGQGTSDTPTTRARPTLSTTTTPTTTNTMSTAHGADSDEGTVKGAHDQEKLSSDPEKQQQEHQPHLDLDSGHEVIRVRRAWYQLWLPRTPPPPAPASLDDAPISPYVSASLLSRLTYTWITPMMVRGFQRTLQASDLWKMGPEQEAGYLTGLLEEAWERRVREAGEWNKRLERGERGTGPGVLRRVGWVVRDGWKGGRRERREERERWWREVGGRREASLAWSLNDVLGRMFWKGGLFKVGQDTAQLMSPLLVKSLINFAKARAAARASGLPEPNLGNGIGMAVGLLLLIVFASICQHQFFFRSMTTGVLARAALTGALYRRALHLTPAARLGLPNSKVLNHISTDVSRVDACAQWFHAAWTAPIQTTVCLIILLIELGPSSLAGFALFVLVVPLQERIMKQQFTFRRASMLWTDKRAAQVLEIISSMRVVKYFCYEGSFLARITQVRKEELKGIRKIQHSQSANIAMAFSLPVLAATLAFVTYTATSKEFDVAVVFASFSLFQLLRQPMLFLPRALSATADARNALSRLSLVFHAPLRAEEPFVVDQAQEAGVCAVGVGWVWEVGGKPSDDEAHGKKRGQKGKGKKSRNASRAQSRNPSTEKLPTDDAPTPPDAEPFALKDISLSVPRGTLAAIVGRVGSGKSSLLQGLIGEMRSTGGKWSFGGSVAYCPQGAWIQNASLRDNILFGRPFEEERYWRVIEDACLLPDLELLADGDLTEGINLSGGQKQRVNIARALYFDADVVIFDDPLSAVDANVGKALFHSAIQGLVARGKTVLLVTHALHFLSQCDYIYTLSNGHIAEAGTYPELIARGGEFARLDKEFGGAEAKEDGEEEGGEAGAGAGESGGKKQIKVVSVEDAKRKSERSKGTGKIEGRLMVKEARTTGGVAWSVYGYYIKAGGALLMTPLIILAATLMQGSAVANSYVLVWWQADSFNRSFSFYQLLYAMTGISQTIFTFILGLVMDFFAVNVSRVLHGNALVNVFQAPMSFFDTTPMGRIVSIFGKDIDSKMLPSSIDNALPMSMRMFILIIAQLIGSVVLITVLEHYFILGAAIVMIGFSYFLQFYRASALEMKRLDSMLRSVLYAHMSESLTGLPTIRSYGEIDRFIRDNKYYIDLQNRAMFLTVTNQRWLAVRLDALGSLLVCLVGIFAAIGVSGISPASLTQMFAVGTRLSAEVENYMNSVERVVHYARGDVVPKEAAHESTPDRKPAADWPAKGAIEFKDVSMSYRPGLPNVLHSISLQVKAGEKIGVVGRTGAGKSSLTLCLLRIVEYEGQITVDE
ncbi:ABC protein [Favolaschia claudopus]|uniref:ABC protein n=1 Tax=Favolaschia claudopus TaxID=2862362 RepID=A0AAW0AXV9_9AGAR